MKTLLLTDVPTSIFVKNGWITFRSGTFEERHLPSTIPYEMVAVTDYRGFISSEAIHILGVRGIPLLFLKFDGTMVGTFIPSEDLSNAPMKIAQIQAYMDEKRRVAIAHAIVKEKTKKELEMLDYLGKKHPFPSIEKAVNMITKTMSHFDADATTPDLTYHYESICAQSYWSALKDVFSAIAPNADFITRKVAKHSPKNAGDSANAVLNFLYTLLLAHVRFRVYQSPLMKDVGFLHYPIKSKESFLYDVEELYRWVAELAAIRFFEDVKPKSSDFIKSFDLVVRLRPDTAKAVTQIFDDLMSRKVGRGRDRRSLPFYLRESVNVFERHLLRGSPLEFNLPPLTAIASDVGYITETEVGEKNILGLK